MFYVKVSWSIHASFVLKIAQLGAQYMFFFGRLQTNWWKWGKKELDQSNSLCGFSKVSLTEPAESRQKTSWIAQSISVKLLQIFIKIFNTMFTTTQMFDLQKKYFFA